MLRTRLYSRGRLRDNSIRFLALANYEKKKKTRAAIKYRKRFTNCQFTSYNYVVCKWNTNLNDRYTIARVCNEKKRARVVE